MVNQNQSANIPDVFGGADYASAKPNEGEIPILAGFYPELEVEGVKIFRSEAKNATFFIVELKIVKSAVPERPVGSNMSWVANFAHQPTNGNVRGFLAKGAGLQLEEVTADVSRGLCAASQPLKGTRLSCQATQILTKGRGLPFTKVAWTLIALSPTLATLAGAK